MDVLAMLDAAYFLGEDKLAEQYAEIAVSRIEKSKKTDSTKAYEYYEFAITLNRLGVYDLAREAIDKALLLQNDDIVLFEDKTYQVSKEPRRLYNELKKEIIRRM